MKPLLLVLQAIGPYAGRQVVDFRPVLDAGLFGIYGATGSGKSTVFSAMMFALFGESARSEQPAATLRSDHAHSEQLTLVELVFSIGDRTFRIVRQPEQMRPAKRGAGETREAHKAWLFDVTGIDIDSMNDANPGKVIAETKVKNVDEAVKKLLGYGPEQFRQTVLLPQGRFEAFLNADTNERVEILRGLFDVSLYRRLTERFKADADAAEKEVSAARAVSARRLSAENFENMEALADGIAIAHDEASSKTSLAAEARTSWESTVDAYAAASRSDAQFREHLDAERELAGLETQRPAIDALTQRLQIARTIQSLADAAEAVESALRDWTEVAAREKEAAERLQIASTQAESAAAKLQSFTARLAEIEKFTATLQCYRNHERVLDDSAALHEASLTADRDAAGSDVAVNETRSRLESSQRECEQIAGSIAAAQENATKRAQLQVRSAELTQRYKDAQAFEKARRNCDDAHKRAKAAAAEAATVIGAWQQAESEFSHAEATILRNQAAHLAAHLTQGESCPVCGSKEHPSPAGGMTGASDVDAAYQSAKSRLESTRRAAETARTAAGIAAESAMERQAAFDSLTAPEEPAAELAAALRQVETDLAGIPAVAAGDLRETLLKAQNRQTAAAEAFDLALKSQTKAAMAAAAARQAYHSALSTIPSDLRQRAVLTAAIAKLERLISGFEKDLNAAMSAEREAAKHLSATTSQQKTIAEEGLRRNERLTLEEQRFAARLAAAGLTVEIYENGKADLTAIPAFETQLQTYSEKRAAAADRLERARAAIAGHTRPDLAALASARDTAKTHHESLEKAASEAGARLRLLEKLRSELSTEAERLARLEKETAPVRELAEAFAGDNERKINLETFAISALFDRVLESANLRLNPMTRGRYALVREIEGKGLARRGLGIAVEDSHTGRQRPTSTLSGGETFIAALALALGLSDVVESAHGSVRLDTIFIDEGFGSLDSDNDSGTLETVLQTLQDIVGATRSVGVISHVPLVQQAIPVGFYVSKTIGGSHIEQRL
ncbi:MAG: SMC family ATPase [Hyphomicrobium sp.]|jgi:exonuclease SbcC|nr:SMC family ATPase [Hyphomicrobium sp.]